MSNELQPYSTNAIIVANNQIVIANNLLAASTRNEIRAFFLRHPMLFKELYEKYFKGEDTVTESNYDNEDPKYLNLSIDDPIFWPNRFYDHKKKEFNRKLSEPFKCFLPAFNRYLDSTFDDIKMNGNNSLLIDKIKHVVQKFSNRLYPSEHVYKPWYRDLNLFQRLYKSIIEALKRSRHIDWDLALINSLNEQKLNFTMSYEDYRGDISFSNKQIQFDIYDIEELHESGRMTLELDPLSIKFIEENINGSNFWEWLSGSKMLTIDLIKIYRDKLVEDSLRGNPYLADFQWTWELVDEYKMDKIGAVIRSKQLPITDKILKKYYSSYQHYLKCEEFEKRGSDEEQDHPDDYFWSRIVPFIHYGIQRNPNLASNLDLIEKYEDMWQWNSWWNGECDEYSSSFVGFSTYNGEHDYLKFPFSYSTILRFRKHFRLKSISTLGEHYSANKSISWTIDIVKLFEEEAEEAKVAYKDEVCGVSETFFITEFTNHFMSNPEIWNKAFKPYVDESFMEGIQAELSSHSEGK